jgi:hypothetical protein
VICEAHRWKKRALPCPYLRCPNGERKHWVVIGKKKKVVYVRRRSKDAWGPRMEWERTDLDPMELPVEEDNEEDDLVF